jgi:RNA-splicing ligase RtcB
MSRKKAFATFKLEEYQKEMAGIYSTSVNELTLDESPMAYKPIAEIVANIEQTAKILNIIKPIYNFKAAEDQKPWEKKKIK